MSKAPFMPLWVSDFLGDTLDLDATEIGAYMLILMAQWNRDGKSLPDDSKKLQRVARCGRNWPKVWGEIERFFERDEDGVFSKRLRLEAQNVASKREVNAQNGARGGRAKALKTNNAGLANATDSLQRNPSIPEPEPYIDDDDSARARDLTEREQLLLAMGHDQSGVTANGRIVGNRSDMAEAERWRDDLGLTHSEQVEVIRDVMRRKSGAPPTTFRYFTEAMRQAAGEKSRPALTASEPRNIVKPQFPRIRARLPE